MTERADLDPRSGRWPALLIGICAAALALTPEPRVAALLSLPVAAALVFWWTIQTPYRWLYLFFGSSLLLPPFPAAVGDSGPHIALAFAALGLLAGALRLRDWRLRMDRLTAALLAFFAVLLLSVPLAAAYSGPAIAAGTLARVLLFAISVYIFVYVAHGPGQVDGAQALLAAGWLFRAAAAAAAFACLDFYFQFPAPAGYGPQFVWLDAGVFRRAQGVFYESSTLGNFCAFFLTMIAVALSLPKGARPVSRTALAVGGALLAAALGFSYSRASLLNVFAALAALLYLQRRHLRIRRLSIGLFLSLGAGAVIVYAAFPSFAESYWTRLWKSGVFFSTAANGILSGRLESWRFLADFLLRQPWHLLAGLGYKTLPYSDFAGRTVIADNMYLSILVETGIVGLAAFMALNAAILRTAWKAARADDATASFFGTWIFCFWIGQLVQMLSGDLFTYWRVLPLYFWTLAVAASLARRARMPA